MVAERLQDPARGSQPQTDEGPILDLANPLATDRELSADLFESMGFLSVQAEVHLDDARLSLREVGEAGLENVAKLLAVCTLVRFLSLSIRNELQHRRVLRVRNRRVERDVAGLHSEVALDGFR